MEDYLQKQLYVHRKSYKYYSSIGIFLCFAKLSFNISGISGVYFLPMIYLVLISGAIEILEKSLKIAERTEEYKYVYKFYRQMLHNFKAEKLSENDINLREEELQNNLNFFPIEKYLKKVKLNGYNIV